MIKVIVVVVIVEVVVVVVVVVKKHDLSDQLFWCSISKGIILDKIYFIDNLLC